MCAEIAMTDTYTGGYKKALLDIEEMLKTKMFGYCRSKKQYEKLLKSFLKRLLQNPDELEKFMDYTGHCAFLISPENEILKIAGYKES